MPRWTWIESFNCFKMKNEDTLLLEALWVIDLYVLSLFFKPTYSFILSRNIYFVTSMIWSSEIKQFKS